MSLNCSANTTLNLPQMAHQLESIHQEDAMYSCLANGCMANNYNADLLDAMADYAYEQDQAMRESSPQDWLASTKESNDSFDELHLSKLYF
jgi:hypothetical protein